MKLEGKVAIVTGGASGLGRATAAYLKSKGMKVAIFDINVDKGTATEKELGVLFVKVNLPEEDSVSAAVNMVKDKLGAPQVVVNCAGIPDCNIEIVSPDLKTVHPTAPWRKIIDINLWGTINVSKHSALAMARTAPEASGERGVIINVASVAGSQGTKGQVAYTASKGAIIGGTIPMARSLGKHGIRVVTISPGPIFTGIEMSPATAAMAKYAALGRFGTAQNFAHLAGAIAENYHVNATVVRMDGGLLKPHI